MLQRNLLKIAGAHLLCFLCTTVSVAQEATTASPDDRWLLAKYDVNGDKLISVDEVEAKRKKMFFSMDMNANGGVSFDEYREVDALKRLQLLQARFKRLDLNQDGELSDLEYSSYLGSFERFDKNGDGNISGAEISRKEPPKKQERVKAPDNDMCLLWFCVRKNIR